MYDILAELQKQDKKITLCKVHAHMRVKGNEKSNIYGRIDHQKTTLFILLPDH